MSHVLRGFHFRKQQTARFKLLCNRVQSSSTPRQSRFPKNVLIRFFNLPLATGSSTAAMTASKCSLRAWPCSLLIEH
jgi:hypothetical protein